MRIPSLDGGGKLPEKFVPSRLSEAALSTAIADRQALGNALPSLELIPFTNYGNSWSAGGVASTPGAGYWSRIASRNRTKAQVNRGVSGDESGEVLDDLVATWPGNQQGIVGLGDIVLNDVRHWATDVDRATTRETLRSMLAHLSAWSIQGSTSTSLVYGPGWNAGVSDGTAGRYVDIAWTGNACDIRVQCVTGVGATLTVKDNSTGSTVATFSTGGFKVAFTGVIRLAGYGAGSHTVRVTTSGAATVSGVIAEMDNPPLIVWLKAGETIEGGAAQRARIGLYLNECKPVAAAFANVIPVDLTGEGWDMNTMLAPDGLHPNDRGNAFIADRIQTELIGQDFLQGLNSMTGTSAGTYTAPTPSYATSGATAPAAPTGATATTGNQVTASWTRASDGGATLTGQPIQASSDGGSSWTTVATATPTASTHIILSGLTAGTSYIFRVGATNSVGTTYSSATTAVTAGAEPVTYWADTFTRADSGTPGSTETGGLAWAATNSATLAIVSNKMTATAPSTAESDAYVDDGHADGTLAGTLSVTTPFSNGLVFRASTATDGYLLWVQASSKNWILSRRTALNTYTQVSVLATGTAVGGDVARIVMNGLTVTIFLNGTQVYTLTDSVNTTKTRHGLWRAGTTNTPPTTQTLGDSMSHTSIITL